MATTTITDRLANYFRAGYPCVCVQTADETRAAAAALDAAKATGRDVVSWDAVNGAVDGKGAEIEDTSTLQAMCRLGRFLPDTAPPVPRRKTVFILKDPHVLPFERDTVLLRAFRAFIQDAPANACTVVVIAPSWTPHPTLEKLVQVIDLPLPNGEELQILANEIGVGQGEDGGDAPAPLEVVRALAGLTVNEAQNACALSWVESDAWDAAVISREKIAAVRRSELLDIIPADPRGLDAIGGFDLAKAWIQKRRRTLEPGAIAYGCEPVKGILLVGPAGCGKSELARCIGTALGWPTLALDMGKLFDPLVGESERKTRAALALADTMAPCVLRIDEIEKGMAGAAEGGGDGGTTKRVISTWLTWMQDRAGMPPVFVVATANDVSRLPPEMLRKGRWDELLAVDLPVATERAEIAAIMLRARRRAPENFDLAAIATATAGFVGSEIKAVVADALVTAYCDAAREVTTADIIAEAALVTPLSTTAREKIEALRAWTATNARPASSAPREALPELTVVQGPQGPRIVGVIVQAQAAAPPPPPEGDRN